MKHHEHDWKAVDTARNLYRCSVCGKDGYRIGWSYRVRAPKKGKPS